MILCDIGNTNAHFLVDDEIIVKNANEMFDFSIEDKIYYICVNNTLKPLLKKKPNFFDLEPHIYFQTQYSGLGIDRICACKSVKNGVIVDIGSAITVDVMENGLHKGGFILPGIKAYETAYATISPAITKKMDFSVCIENLPQNTKDAVSYAVLKSIVLCVSSVADKKTVYFTGGGGERLSEFFQNSIYDKMLIFKTLKDAVSAIINKEKLC